MSELMVYLWTVDKPIRVSGESASAATTQWGDSDSHEPFYQTIRRLMLAGFCLMLFVGIAPAQEDTIPDLPQALKVRSLAYNRNQNEWALCFADSLVDQAANTHYQQEEPHNWASHTVHIFVTGQLPPNCTYTFGFVRDNDAVYQMVPVGRFAEAGRDHFSILSWGADIDAPQAIWRWSEAKQAIVPPSHPWEHTMVMFDVKPDGTLWCRYRIDVPRMFERTTLYVGHLPNASKPIQTPYIISQIPRVLKLSRIIKTSGDAAPGKYPLQARYVYADGSESVTDYTLTIKE